MLEHTLSILLGQRNYTNESKQAILTIDKCKLNARITGHSFDKVYDGTTDIREEQNFIRSALQ